MCHFRVLLKTYIDYSDICCLEKKVAFYLFSHISLTGQGGITKFVLYKVSAFLHFACVQYHYYFEK